MVSIPAFSAFISYTAEDLSAHADVVASVLRKLRVMPIDHRDSGSTGEPSVSWCKKEIENADLLIVLVAHRYGWIPSKEETGDGKKSITQIEVEHAWKMRKRVLPYILEDSALWQLNMIEGLHNPAIQESLTAFKRELKKTIAGFFSDPKSLDGPISRDIPRALDPMILKRAAEHPSPLPNNIDHADAVVPWIYDRNNPPSVMDRMKPEIPKRILSLEGGGVDCFVCLGYLEKIERILQIRYSDPEFRIADYYDLIIGNGFNSIVATELCMGKSIRDIEPVFKEIFKSFFSRKSNLFKRFNYLYDPEPLYQSLKQHYGKLTLDSEILRTGLALVVTRFDQYKPWHFLNHRGWEYFESLKKIGLDKLLECSLALPSYIPYSILDLGNSDNVVIGDGSFATGNDCSLYALLLVKNQQFPYRWRFGENMLSLTTVGSKGKQMFTKAETFKNINLLQQIPRLIDSLINCAGANSELMLSSLADNESDSIEKKPVLTHTRFDILISADTLSNLGLAIDQKTYDDLFNNELIGNIDRFIEIGRLAANKQITPDYFSPSFDVRNVTEIKK